MKNIFIVNSGSSSIKYQLIEMPSENVLVKGMIDAIGTKNSVFSIKSKDINIQEKKEFINHEIGLHYIISALKNYHIISDYSMIDACGHRVAHGGELFKESKIIDEVVANQIDRLGILAPLHNPTNLLGYQILKDILKNAKHVAVFDTSYHHTLKEDSYIYPIDYHYYVDNHIRKYGFHGTSCDYVCHELQKQLGSVQCQKMIICHLGNGASVTAVKDGKSIDTSMGLTPLGGIVMGTRSGNIDPSLVEYIALLRDKNVSEIMAELNYQSGLLGISQTSQDMRILCEQMNSNHQAKLAIEVYVKRIADYIGAYFLHLGGLDVLAFTAGIGENSSIIRTMIVNKISEALNIEINNLKNQSCSYDLEMISTERSQVKVCVIKTNEEMMIARDTYRLLNNVGH